VRIAVLLCLAGCGSGVPTPAKSTGAGSEAAKAETAKRVLRANHDFAVADPIAALVPDDAATMSFMNLGRVQLEIGGSMIESPGGTKPLRVMLIGRQGDQVRAAVDAVTARFSVWTSANQLYSLLQSEQRVELDTVGPIHSEAFATLHAGARVRRIARRGDYTKVRYLGALQIEGWVPDSALGLTAAARTPMGRMGRGRRPQHVTSGTVVRGDTMWASTPIAVVAQGYLLDLGEDMKDGWWKVSYLDGDIEVHGFWSRSSAPSSVVLEQDPDPPPPLVTPNETIPSGTCLHSQIESDQVGYVVGDVEGELVASSVTGWYSLTLDTPWGPITFGVQGSSVQDLVACAPPATVPPSKLRPSAP
jgi:hypothetical protein